MKKLGIIIFFSVVFPVFGQNNHIFLADSKILRVKPADWTPSPNCPKMPKHIVKYLENLHCTIPQRHNRTENYHGNAFQIEFAEPGQFDWAVLCSRNRISSILVFWNSSTKNVGEFASYPDKDFIRAIDGKGNFGFSRGLGKSTTQGLYEKHKETYGDIFHEISYWGIDEILPDWTLVRYHMYKNQLVVLEDKNYFLKRNL